MIWGYINFDGKLKIFKCPPRMNAKTYVEFIENEVLDDFVSEGIDLGNMVFVQDNAPCHRAKSTKEWFRNNNITLQEWPAQSPDMNIIENVWDVLDIAIRNRGINIENKDILWNLLVEEAEKIHPSFIKKLYHSIPRRLNALKKAKFMQTKY